MIKRLLLISVLAFLAGCKKSEKIKIAVSNIQSGNTAPARYVENLRSDVEKAEAVRDKANTSTRQTEQNIDDTLKEAESK